MNFKNIIFTFSFLLISGFLLSACNPKFESENINLITNMTQNTNNSALKENNSALQNPTPASTSAKVTNNTVVLTTKDGQITLNLFLDKTPNTVANFINKVNSGFYNGLTFHRVEPGFVIQGGDPLGNGTGGGSIKSEINNIPFVRGSIGLARANDINVSNDSQFYICLSTETCSQLTGKYVNFGEVVSGLDVVDKVQKGDKIIKAEVK